ncbi:MAG: hypothetical protein AAB403_09475 [Planctomycetota bacterium]
MDGMYSLFTHRHNFAVWAAARASQRGFTTVSNLKAALEASKLPLVIQNPSEWPACAEQFDSFHRLYCGRIVDYLTTGGVTNVPYGRAAKLMAVYLKSMIVVSEHARSTFAAIIHPPVDRSLLQNLARDRRFDQKLRHHWRNLNWTGLSGVDYFALINEFRRNGLDKPEFWMLERYWDPTREVQA